MGIEGEDYRLPVRVPGLINKVPKEILMSPVDAVEVTYGQVRTS
jgi:hypothetical protein